MIEFSDRTARVAVPATSANLGPGFDCFGLALDLVDEVSACVIDDGVHVSFTGEGADTLPRDDQHLIVRAMRATFAELGRQPPGLRIDSVNRIPHGRGLGSSAAAIIAGIQLARRLVRDPDAAAGFDDAAALALATEIEGHPDNVAACLLGGLTLAWTTNGRARATQLSTSAVRPAVFIPAGESSTALARAALPAHIVHSDAAFNAGRAAMLVIALTGRPDLLLEATEDRLHQQHRAASMPASAQLLSDLRHAGLAAVISGAGSSVLVLATDEEQRARAHSLRPDGWKCLTLQVARGAQTSMV